VPVAQYLDSYIIAQDGEGLVIVDQHAAHERILFERYLAQAQDNGVEVQKLLFPITVELAPHEFVILEEEAEEMRRLGFLIEPFGGRTVRLDGVPALAGEQEPEALLRELIGEARRARSAASDVESLRRRLVTTAACKAAVKLNHRLTHGAMQGLLDDLFETVNPSTCPHGRPLLFRLTLEELEKAFNRR
jgi:DNA mismatch repair protein MutL